MQRYPIVSEAMESLRPGDVLLAPARKAGGARPDGRVAVLSTSQRKKGDISLRAITAHRKLVSLSPRDFRQPPQVVARLDVPAPFAPKNREFQRQMASLLGSAQLERHHGAREHQRRHGALDDHPVASCPDARAHLRAAARAERLRRQVENLKKQVKGRSESLARQFDRVLGLLESWGYVHGWSLTASGERLARIYHEQDLLVAECAEEGLFDGLRPAEMAAVASFFTYEPRGPATEVPELPNKRAEQQWRAVQGVWRHLVADEEKAGLPPTRAPDPGFASLAYGWASGRTLSSLLSGSGRTAPHGERTAVISAGDFVRNLKQLVDLLRQLSEVLPGEVQAAAARQAADALFHGVVAASSVVTPAGAVGPR